jgi:hypothetical protein
MSWRARAHDADLRASAAAAAGGHYAQALAHCARRAGQRQTAERLAPALDRALAIGATSGADTLRGLLHGAAAWSTAVPPGHEREGCTK